MNSLSRNKLFTFALIALVAMGGGCVAPWPRPGDTDPIKKPVATSTVGIVSAPARECEVSLSSDANVPLSAKYKYTGVMGAMFTAFDCGDPRATSVFNHLGLGNLKQDLWVGIQYMPQRSEVYRALEDMGFVCEKSLNSAGSVLYEGGCKINAGNKLTLASLKSFYGFKPDLSYSYFLLAPDQALRSDFIFEHKISKADSVCRQQPVDTEIGSTEYAIATVYASKVRKMGEIFTQYQCGNAPYTEEGARFGWGSKLKLISTPTSDFKSVLERAGFVCDDQYQSHSGCTEWTLIAPVPIEYLFPIEHHLDEIEGESCFHCG